MPGKSLWLGVFVAAAFVIGTAARVQAQAEIKVSDDVNFKLGILGQFQLDALDDTGTDVDTKNLFARRLRLMFGGEVAKGVTFFVETDTPNLGKVASGAKNIQPATIIQDAYGEFKPAQVFMVDAGLMFVPFSRNSVQSAATLLPIDYGAYTFTQSSPTQSATGRDAGAQARGYLLGDHLEYRFGAFQGVRDALSSRPFRYVGRLQYNVLDTEDAFFYTGTYMGKKRIVAIGGAFDTQDDYHGYDADAFIDLPFGPGAATAQLDLNRFDGGTTLPAIAKQNTQLLELGYFIEALKLTPFLQFARRDILSGTAGDETRASIGASFWAVNHNANVKGAYTRVRPTGLARQNEFTVQLQLFYF
jgi:Phosphate-selective porin O and P